MNTNPTTQANDSTGSPQPPKKFHDGQQLLVGFYFVFQAKVESGVIVPDPGQEDLDSDGSGDRCDGDRYGVAGGGCAAGGAPDLGALLALAPLALVLRRRRRRA